jgi:hypothetical protein
MQSLLARLPTDLALKARLVLHHPVPAQCAVVCHHHQRRIMSLLAHTTLSRRNSLPSRLRHNHNSINNSSRLSLTVSRTPIMALMLRVSLHHRHLRQLVLVAHQVRGRVRVRCHLMVVPPARRLRCAPLLRTDQDLHGTDIRARTSSTTLTLLPIAVSPMVLLHQLLLLLLLSKLRETVTIVRQLHHRSDTASGRTAIT